MILTKMFAIILPLICLTGRVSGLNATVTVGDLGTVIGLEETSTWTGRTIYAFRGIPYAEAPVGDLRFRPPVSVSSWNGTWNGTEFGVVCPQNSGIGTPLSGVDEDCLTLNVYVPEVNSEDTALPVMIYLHGGTFMSGYAQLYEPHQLLEEDVILVVPQFRLGPLGLLCLQTDEVPGNVQFLDQIMAMQWVQDNIGYFGGDPDSVTLFGQSSGAASVNLHQISPLSTGLFHKVILQSGSAYAPWVMDYNPVQTATRLGAVMGCNQTNTTELAACFKELTVQTILDGFATYLATYSAGGLTEIGGHRAVIQTAGTQKFLEEDPLTLISKGQFSQIPMIAGATKHDGSFALAEYYTSYFVPYGFAENTQFLKYNLTSFILSAFGVEDLTGGVGQTLTYAHFNEDDIGDFLAMVPGIIDICSVFAFKAPIFQMLQTNSLYNSSYLYRFGYFGTNNVLVSAEDLPFETGVGHSDELFYLFPLSSNLSDTDVTVAKRMVSLWTTFATSGVPIADDKTWESMSTPFGPYLIIDEEFYDGTNYLSEYTIARDEGMTAVDRSAASGIAPPSIIILATTLWSIFIRR
ncbi:juvenile hormone esterase [Neodiprion lecontei]|uniref:Carboxylic ester hydrolase n=1 Tax=Neodiprion lecontei TaxID=441921 RepID=A0A6J0BZI1_NEOLC|nr:juvenile hormone esterase [Neodiprion lecontei]